MRMRAKLTFLLCTIIVMVASTIVLERNFEVKRLTSLFEISRKEKEIVFSRIVDLKNNRLAMFVNDYAARGDLTTSNLETSISNFGINLIWIYRPDLSLLYHTGNFSNGDIKEVPVAPDALKNLFDRENFCHFFASTDMGLIEIEGAAIYPFSDREGKMEPIGYIFAGFLWDENFLNELAVLTESHVRFASVYEKKNPGTSSEIAKGEATFLNDLKDWQGKPIARVAVLFKSESIIQYNRTGRVVLYMFMFFSAAILLTLLFLLVRWVTGPLRLVSKALSRKNPSYLKEIRGSKDEIGDIAKVILKFFEQSDELKSENIERLKAEFQERAILDNIPDIAWLKDKEGRFIAVNESFARACGTRPEELIGKTDFDIWPKELAEKYIADDKEVMLWGKRKLVTEPLFSIDGEMSWIETVKTPIYNDKNEIIGTTGISRDVTERRKSEEELKKAYVELKEAQHRLMQAEKYAALGKFSSAFAHEIKNPLGIILNGIEFLEMKLGKSDLDVKEDLEIIKKSTFRADGIIQRLLKFARPTRAEPEKIHVDDLINETLAFFKYTSPTSEIKINTEFSKDEMCIEVDKNQMQQALVNLILNAVEAMPNGGEIFIKTYMVERSEYYFAKPACIIDIIDNGCGISEENLYKIFEPFFTTKSEKGTGLGLFITKIIINNNKGNVTVESRVGKGTKIKIILPLFRDGS